MTWPNDFYRFASGDACPICTHGGGDPAAEALFFEGRVSDGYLKRSPLLPGQSVLYLREHAVELADVEPSVAHAYIDDLRDLTAILRDHFEPVKMNFEMLGNFVPHLHTHVLPRYDAPLDPAPGAPFPWHMAMPRVVPADQFDATLAALKTS